MNFTAALIEGLRHAESPLSNVEASSFSVEVLAPDLLIHVKWHQEQDDFERILAFRKSRDRWEASGVYPSRKNGSMYVEVYDSAGDTFRVPTITVSADKSWYLIGRDVGRRYAANYLKRFSMVVKKLASEAEYAEKQRRLVDQLGVALGSPPTYLLSSQRGCAHLADSRKIEIKGAVDDKIYGHLEVTGSRVDVELRNLQPSQALALAKFLKTL